MNTCNHFDIYIKLQKALAYGHLFCVAETHLQQIVYMTADFPVPLLQLLLNAGHTAISAMLRVEFLSLATGSDDIVHWVILGPDSRDDARCDTPINKWVD